MTDRHDAVAPVRQICHHIPIQQWPERCPTVVSWPRFPDADRHLEEGAIAVDQVEDATIIPETARGRVMRIGADGSRHPDMGQLASVALRSTALIVISIVLILVLLPAALVAAGT